MYHVLARSARRELIVLGNDDRWMFLRIFGEMAKRMGEQIAQGDRAMRKQKNEIAKILS